MQRKVQAALANSVFVGHKHRLNVGLPGVAMRLAAVIIPVIIPVVGFCVQARADIAPEIFSGGTGIEIDRTEASATALAAKIEMKKERVTITLHSTAAGAFAVVDATFSMSASTPAKLPVVFPGAGVPVGGGYAVHPPLVGFHAFVDGKPVASTDKEITHSSLSGPPGREYTTHRSESWHKFPATIDDDTVIRVRYAVQASALRNDDGFETGTHASVSYILHTGALWAKDIGAVIVEVKGAGVDVNATSLRTMSMAHVSLVSLTGDGAPPSVQPVGAVRTADAITWTATQLEPTANDDVEVVFPRGAAASSGSPSPPLAELMRAAAR